MIFFKEFHSLGIDVSDWRAHTVYTNEFSDSHPVVQSFWNILNSWTTENQSLLLAFATGYSYPPVLSQ